MTRISSIRTIAAAAILAGALAAPALADPAADGKITFSGGSAAFIVGGSWGSGTLTFKGHTYPLKVSGLGIGAIGASSYKATGDVFHLTKASDIEGTYGAADASATAGTGAGVLDMTNPAGVEIRATTTTQGLKLSAAPSGVVIKLK
ncbi:MAG: hypothetical protein ACHP7N_06170 [Caulobacterales bacterium]